MKRDASAKIHPDDGLPYAALEELLRRAHLQRTTGKLILLLDVNQGGVRAVRIGTDEIFKTGFDP